ncbi:hypothetical protein HBI15_222820 [Parastagonospora nodorum]|nr:hypothetical protein HBI15_222820 [Parastagonospora nodorum]
MSLHCTSSPLKVPLQLHCRMHVPLLKYEEDSHQQAQIPHRLRRQGQSDSYDSAYVLLRGRWETLCKEAGESDHRGWGGGGGGGGGAQKSPGHQPPTGSHRGGRVGGGGGGGGTRAVAQNSP